MDSLILEPLKYYTSVLKERHKQNLTERFDELVSESGIDVEANRAAVKKYDAEREKIAKEDAKLRKYSAFFALLIFGSIIGIILLFAGINYISDSQGIPLLISGVVLTPLGFIIAFAVIRPKKKAVETIKAALVKKANEYKDEALSIMAPLNRLFDTGDTLSLIEKTLPKIKFDKIYGADRERELIDKYDYIDLTDDNTSVTNMLSGTLFGNPFLFERYLSCAMGTQVYHGTRTISWTETYRDSNGKLRTRVRTQVLHASVTKPKPFYNLSTHLGYGSQAAPDLSFSRRESDSDELSERALIKRIKAGEKKLQKQEREALKNGGTFQAMTNTEFDVLFGAKNRNHEVQFRLMFTPLAQTNTVDLLRSKDGYGDDFNFIKQGKFNIIKSIHAQSWDMRISVDRYRSHSVDLSKKAYLDFNENYFKSLYFDFAPLMSIPVYQEEPVASMEQSVGISKSYYTSYEHEALANAIGEKNFSHENSATQAILKTSPIEKRNDIDRVRVDAYSFAGIDRLDLIPVLGGDGRMHTVPVPWIEYIPLKKSSEMVIRKVIKTEKELWSDPRVPIHSAFRDGLLAILHDKTDSWDKNVEVFKDFI